MQSVVVLLTHIALPALFLWWLAGSYIRHFNVTARAEAFALFAGFIAFILYILLAGAWGIVGYWMRPLIALGAIGASVLFLVRLRCIPRNAEARLNYLRLGTYLAPAALFSAFLFFAVKGLVVPRESIDLRFPLDEGLYAVGQGGSSAILNYHQGVSNQAYALDISELGPLLMRARGLFPRDPAKYKIFGDTVFAPCDGEVVWTHDGLDDTRGAQREKEQPAGNAVAIECGGATVFLAHLQKGSVRVTEGERVAAGDAVGVVGNSGNTTEPHLHIHAEKGAFAGEFSENPGLAMRFSGRFLVRGSLIFEDRRAAP